jgi:hypothetical protein
LIVHLLILCQSLNDFFDLDGSCYTA